MAGFNYSAPMPLVMADTDDLNALNLYLVSPNGPVTVSETEDGYQSSLDINLVLIQC